MKASKRFAAITILSMSCQLGCTSQALRIQSQPEGAEVSLIQKDQAPVTLGKTPLELDSKNDPRLLSGSAQIQVFKEGYFPQSVLIPNLASTGGSGQVSFNLSQTELPKACQLQESSLNEVARGVAELASLIQKRHLEEAETLAQTLISKFNSVSPLYDLQGNIFYLQKDLNRALTAYKKSNTLSPNNPQTLKMIDRISQMQVSTGGR